MLPIILMGACACLGADIGAVFAARPAVAQANYASDSRFAGSPVAAPQIGEIERAADGLFYVTATVNGAPVRFVVDTGATMVVLRSEDALRAGIMPMQGQRMAIADTANGRTAMARVRLTEVVVGGTRAQAIEAAVASNGLPVSLLGQNWLRQLSSLTISGDRLTFQ